MTVKESTVQEEPSQEEPLTPFGSEDEYYPPTPASMPSTIDPGSGASSVNEFGAILSQGIATAAATEGAAADAAAAEQASMAAEDQAAREERTRSVPSCDVWSDCEGSPTAYGEAPSSSSAPPGATSSAPPEAPPVPARGKVKLIGKQKDPSR